MKMSFYEHSLLRPLKWKRDFGGGRKLSRRQLSHFSGMLRRQRLFLTGTPTHTHGSGPTVTGLCGVSLCVMQMFSKIHGSLYLSESV